MFMVLLAAVKVLLYRHSGQTDIVVGTPVANRNRLETEALIGFFVNTLPLRTRFSGSMAFRELLRRVRAGVLDISAHQDLPFEKIVEELRPERHLGRTPLYQVVFTMQNTPAPALVASSLTMSPVMVESATAKFDLTFNAWESLHGIAFFIEHSSDLFEAATIARLWRHFECLLESIVGDPEASLDSLEILPEEERSLLARPVMVDELEEEFSF